MIFVKAATSGSHLCRGPAVKLVVENLRKFNNLSPGRCRKSLPVARWPSIPSASRLLLQYFCHRCLRSQCLARTLSTSLSSKSASETGNLGLKERDLPVSSVVTDPFKLAEEDLHNLFEDIRKELNSPHPQLREIAVYYFDGQGKAFRPMITVLMGRAINSHILNRPSELLSSQRTIAMTAEMIHTATLMHDDVIDASDLRRGKPSISVLWGHKKPIFGGDFVLAITSAMVSRIRNEEVMIALSKVLTDLVQGEFMQLGSKEDENERFAHYLMKTYKKTASLIAYTCKAVSILGGGNDAVQDVAYQYGRNVGMAFQIVDDLLDFVSTQSMMGKPTAADLKLGLATAPVLFACEKFPELNTLIMRRFSEPGDVEMALDAVRKSDGLEQTRFLAQQHCLEAIRYIEQLRPSPEQKALISLTDKVLNRLK